MCFYFSFLWSKCVQICFLCGTPKVMTEFASMCSTYCLMSCSQNHEIVANSVSRLTDGTRATLFIPLKGFAVKSREAPAIRVTAAQLKHAVWCQAQGDRVKSPDGSKMFPHLMEESMWLHGTKEGATLYSGDEYFQANADGQPTFKMCEVLSAQQLKAYASKTSAVLAAQLKKAQNAELPPKDPANLLVTLTSRAEIEQLTCKVIRECLKLKHAPLSGGNKAECRQAISTVLQVGFEYLCILLCLM